MVRLRRRGQSRALPLLRQITRNTIGYVGTPGVRLERAETIAFESTSELLDPTKAVKGDLAPPFNADGNAEIYLTKGRKRIWQLTSSQGCENTEPSIMENGETVAFVSSCDLVPGNNSNGLPQLFIYEEVNPDEPLYGAASCQQSQGCCNQQNGCYQQILGRQIRPPSSLR